MARYRMFFSDAKARQDLGYVSRPYREAIADAIGWFRTAGYLPPAQKAVTGTTEPVRS